MKNVIAVAFNQGNKMTTCVFFIVPRTFWARLQTKMHICRTKCEETIIYYGKKDPR